MNSPKLSAWLEDQRLKKENATLLETALLNNKMGCYYLFRFRYFSIKCLLTLFIAWLQIKILVEGFSNKQVILTALISSALATLISTFWWAGLETMRKEIRKQKRSENGGILIPQILSLWQHITSKTLLVGFVIGTLSLSLYLGFGPKTPPPLQLYLLALLVKVLLEIPLRAFHSCVYATRRIYKPLHWILGIEALGFISFVSLYPAIGAWSVGTSALLTTLLNFGISWKFINKTYQHLGYSNALKILKSKPKKPYPAPKIKEFLQEGIPLTLFRLDSLVLLTLLASHPNLTLPQIYFLALCLPMLHICQEWAQLLYFDYKRLELHHLENLRKRFENGGKLMPFLVALSLWILLPVGLWGAAPTQGFQPAPWESLILLLSSSLLAKSTMRTYSLGQNKTLLLLGGILLLGLLSLHLFQLPLQTLLLLISTLLLLTHVFLIAAFQKRPIDCTPTALIPLGHWTCLLSQQKNTVQGGILKISPSHLSPNYVKLSIAKGIKNLLQKENQRAYMTNLTEDTLLYYSAAQDPQLVHLIQLACGTHLKTMHHYSKEPTHLVHSLAQHEPILRYVQEHPPDWPSHAPTPICFCLTTSASLTPPIPPKDAQEIFHGAKEHLLKGKPPNPWDLWDVTTEENLGVLSKIYAFGKATPSPVRRLWRQHILAKTLHHSWTTKAPTSRKKEKEMEEIKNKKILQPASPVNPRKPWG